MIEQKKTIIGLVLSIVILSMMSCTHEKSAEQTDKELYEMSKSTNGFVWYKNSGEFLDKSTGSGHAQPLLRTRYNAIAATSLDSDGKIQAGASFPEGSLIVKELYTNENTLAIYAILYKNALSPDADTRGWVWGYINANGSVVESASKKGAACINCHSQSESIDYMLMNKFFP